MQIVRFLRGNMSEVILIRNLSALKYRDHEVGTGDQSNVLMVDSGMKYILNCKGREGQNRMKNILAVSVPQQ